MFLFLFFTILQSVFCFNSVDYYEKLINQSKAEAKVFELPTRNKEFEAGSKSTKINDFGSYDFIIVGAGSAGAVVATRLSEIGEWKILLLEAGGEENDFSMIPAMQPYLPLSDFNWGYLSIPQKNSCLAMKEKRCMLHQGKAVGGGSAINMMMYVRGNPEDFNRWVLLGNPGWSYEEVRPYFIKSENSQIGGDEGYHGKGGFWNVEYALPPTEIFSKFIEGNAELNIPMTDINGKQQIGTEKVPSNIKRGKRQSTGSAFLDNARKRDNLRVITKALVTKIEIDEGAKTAQGVIFVANNTKFRATARKEVIVSAGAYNSAQLLMLSGIGPKQHLEEMDIEVIRDLPVGFNLLEHPLMKAVAFRTNYTLAKTAKIGSVIEQYLNGYGPLTRANDIDALGFLPSRNSSGKVPMTEYFLSVPVITDTGSSSVLLKSFNFKKEFIEHSAKHENANTFSIYLALLHPKSKGRVTLKSNDPIDFPDIDTNMYAKSEDIDNLIEGIEFLLKLEGTEAFKRMNATLVDPEICEEFEKLSRDFWSCVIRHTSITISHPHGTTAMGPNETNSVVDTNLKVHGIEKLRIVGAGVIPVTTSGHLTAPVVMMGEKISDVIKNDYGKL